MFRLFKPLLLASVVAGGLVFSDARPASADEYWNSYWSWYDNSYRPYYYRRHRNYYRDYDYDDYRRHRSYYRRPYDRRGYYYRRPSGGSIQLGPLQLNWR